MTAAGPVPWILMCALPERFADDQKRVRFGPERFPGPAEPYSRTCRDLSLRSSDDWRQRLAKQAIEVMTNHSRIVAALLKQEAGHR